MTQWILEKSVGFTDVCLLRISESVRAYAYLILSSQASARSGIVGNTVSAQTARSAFLNNFENVVNLRVDIREDIKRYQDTLRYASSKVNYRVGQNVYMLPSDMNVKIKTNTVGYNNKILVSDGKFSLGKNDEVNLTAPVMKSHAQTTTNSNDALSPKGTPLVLGPCLVVHRAQKPNISHGVPRTHKQEPTHNKEKIALVLSLTGIFTTWFMFWWKFNKKVFSIRPFCMGHLLRYIWPHVS